ncbi:MULTISPECIES: PKD domain-containing protein [unclassified Crossiella]|uniref:PKD domain-containing protein n=1 Tax=unclassified Crossiella TaxID=2620835 RepID=UPI001FFE670B|nr:MULTISPECIES: PKD domain-containing protein [unclassified Crossiella]MCK2241696.1 PKD domain-containing protein [Crossiella sp. S99.2]MCK2255432.1 PKD domain-containing protein [Crossiella sp. S99.1]
MRRTLGTLIVSTALALAAGPAAQAEATGVVLNAGAAEAIPGQYIVGLRGAGSLDASAATAVSAESAALTQVYGGTIGFTYSAALRGFSVAMSPRQAERLAADPKVDFVQQSLWVRAATVKAPAGEQPNAPWGLDQIDGANDGTYKYPNTGTGVTVYNTDTELNLDHVSFEGRAKSGYDFIDNDTNVNDCKGQFDQGHGTHTGGTSSSEAYGVAKDVTIIGVKVLGCDGNGPDAASIKGIDWVTQNARKPAVANASWTSGGAGADPEGINRAMKNSIAAGITWVVAAGNENQDACNVSPAKLPEAITVAATQDEQNTEAGYSNHGSCVDIYAPGSNINSASNSDNNGSRGMQGTSMAAPHVTGGAALYLAANTGASPQQVRDALVNNAQSGVVRNIGPGSPNKFLDVSKFGGGTQPGKPSAEFTGDCANSLTCSFDGSASKPGTGGSSITGYKWEFGDTATGEGAKPSHTYAKDGEYRVTLTVTDDKGATSAPVTKSVRAGKPPAGQPPTASFTVSCQRDKCSFNGSGSTDPDNDIDAYAWDFGDGQTGTGATTSHSYPNKQASYAVKLTVTDKTGNSNSTSKQVQCWSFGSGQAFCFG